MTDHKGVVGVVHLLHKQMLWLLVASYCAAACVPGPGLWLRQQRIEVPALSPGGVASAGGDA